MQFNQALQVKYCLRPPTPTTAIAINARVEPVSGTDGGLMAVILPIRVAEADAPSKTENLLISLNPPPVTEPNPIFIVYSMPSTVKIVVGKRLDSNTESAFCVALPVFGVLSRLKLKLKFLLSPTGDVNARLACNPTE